MSVTELPSGELEITLIRGDSDDFLITVTDDAEPTPNKIDLSKAVDGTASRPAIIRFAVKSDPELQANPEGLVFKTSHYADQVEFLAQAGATLGQARILLDKPDTEAGNPELAYVWDLEVTRQDGLRTGASGGQVTFTPGSTTVVGTATAFTKAKKGDILQPLGVLNNGTPALIEEVLSNTSVVVSFGDWQAEGPVNFEIRRGKHKTAARGPFVLVLGVVGQ